MDDCEKPTGGIAARTAVRSALVATSSARLAGLGACLRWVATVVLISGKSEEEETGAESDFIDQSVQPIKNAKAKAAKTQAANPRDFTIPISLPSLTRESTHRASNNICTKI
jgi:hypothetical protein